MQAVMSSGPLMDLFARTLPFVFVCFVFTCDKFVCLKKVESLKCGIENVREGESKESNQSDELSHGLAM